jgi:hypothetical protein
VVFPPQARLCLAQAWKTEGQAFLNGCTRAVASANKLEVMRVGRFSVQNIGVGFDRIFHNGEFVVVGGGKMCLPRRQLTKDADVAAVVRDSLEGSKGLYILLPPPCEPPK